MMLVVVLMVKLHLSLGVALVSGCIDCLVTLMLVSQISVIVKMIYSGLPILVVQVV